MEKYYEFKASSVELAIKNGLTELGLSEDQADIEVVSNGGVFSKALVRITPKPEQTPETEQTLAEETVDSEVIANDVTSEVPSEETATVSEEKVNQATYALMKEMRDLGKEYLKEIANLMGVSVTLEGKVKDDEICIYIGGEDAKAFIGYKGETLEATQTLVSNYLNKNLEERIRVVVDADFYRERRRKTLTALAKKLARIANSEHREISLEPMNSYERRIIHSALTNSEDATTRSEGEGKYRHVVIVPNSGTMSYGNSTNFRKKGPQKTKSFGYNKRKF